MKPKENLKTDPFKNKVEEAERLLTRFYEHPQEGEGELCQFINTPFTARAFLVAFLTGSLFNLNDHAGDIVIEMLRKKIEFTAEVLIKNLVMSRAMILTHQKNNDETMSEQSKLVNERTLKTIKLIGSEILDKKRILLLEAIQAKTSEQVLNTENPFSDFLERWQYDTKQLKAMKETLESISA